MFLLGKWIQVFYYQYWLQISNCIVCSRVQVPLFWSNEVQIESTVQCDPLCFHIRHSHGLPFFGLSNLVLRAYFWWIWGYNLKLIKCGSCGHFHSINLGWIKTHFFKMNKTFCILPTHPQPNASILMGRYSRQTCQSIKYCSALIANEDSIQHRSQCCCLTISYCFFPGISLGESSQ